jgi:hypothetical protein
VLLNAAAIQALTPQQAADYVNGYQLGAIQAAQHKKAIARFVGCTVTV